jgi:hypothetical protein
MFRLNYMILLLTISTHTDIIYICIYIYMYITKVFMINFHHIAKDSFQPTQVIATKHLYPKHLFIRVVQGKGIKF